MIGRMRGGGEDVEELEAIDDGGEEVDDEASEDRGAIGIGTSVVLLYAGYPSHLLPDRTHLLHSGRVSSHLTLRALQLLHPVLTLGRLALRCLLALAVVPVSIVQICAVHMHCSPSNPSIAQWFCSPKLWCFSETGLASFFSFRRLQPHASSIADWTCPSSSSTLYFFFPRA
jgi:hypothetical protein